MYQTQGTMWRHQWSTQLYQLLGWKIIPAWTKFKPITSAILMQCSCTDWAIKPTGSLSHCGFVITTLDREELENKTYK